MWNAILAGSLGAECSMQGSIGNGGIYQCSAGHIHGYLISNS